MIDELDIFQTMTHPGVHMFTTMTVKSVRLVFEWEPRTEQQRKDPTMGLAVVELTL